MIPMRRVLYKQLQFPLKPEKCAIKVFANLFFPQGLYSCLTASDLKIHHGAVSCTAEASRKGDTYLYNQGGAVVLSISPRAINIEKKEILDSQG